MLKGSEIRIVGNASEYKKTQAKEEIFAHFSNHLKSLSIEEQEILKECEYKKTEKQLALIDFANNETSNLIKEFGIEPYNIPYENLHIVPNEFYIQIAKYNTEATVFHAKQSVFFNYKHFNNNPVRFGFVTLHEILHLKSHFSIEIQENSKTPYRAGISVYSSQKHSNNTNYHEHFEGLHEAIVSETEKKLSHKILNHPKLSKEKNFLASDEINCVKKYISLSRNIPEDDIVWIVKNGTGDYSFGIVSYPKQRDVFNYVCSEIQKEFPKQFKNTDQVYKTFLKAQFTGKILDIGRLVEKTFGNGGFRLLGNMSEDRKSGTLHLEALKRARNNYLNK